MIAAVIVLSVVALALGGYILADILRGKKVAAEGTPVERDDPQKNAEEAPPVAPENESAAADETEAETADAFEPETETLDEKYDEEPNADNDGTDIDKSA